MASARKKGKGGTPSLSRQPSQQGPTPAELLERARDELCSLEAIYADDYTLISDAEDKPLHCQIRVRPLPMESDAANHVSVLLDAMLSSASPLPLLVLRRGKGVSEALLEQLQTALDAEAARLVAKGEEAIIYSLVCFLTELLQPHNVAPKSFHEQMIERAATTERAAAAQARSDAEQLQQARQEEKEALRMQIDAANRKKEEALRAKEMAHRKSPAASVAASPALLSSSPPALPGFHLGVPAVSPSPAHVESTAGAAKGKRAASAAPASASSAAASSSAAAASSSALAMPAMRRDVSQRTQKRKAKAQDRGKARHKPRELREAPPSDSEQEDSSKKSGSDEDDSGSEESGSDSESGSSSEDDGSEFSDEAPPPARAAKPAASGRKGASSGLSAMDQLMRDIELKDAAAEKTRLRKAASAARRNLHAKSSGSEGSDAEQHDLSDLDDDESDLTSESDDEGEASPSRMEGQAVPGASWLERNVSSNSDVTTAAAASAAAAANAAASSCAAAASAATAARNAPNLPYYSRFHTDFEGMELLGKGGFGEVFKVRNKVDRLYYAVKRIKLTRNNPTLNQKMIKEVSFIAMLHHRYIVRYYNAWIEGEDASDATTSTSKSSETADKTAKKPPLQRKGTATQHSQLEHDEDDEDWLAPSRPSTMEGFDGGSQDDDNSEDDDDESESNDDSQSASPLAAGRSYLYIQMEYCPNKTLRDIIDERLCDTHPEDCWRLFRQLLEAVAYIHKKGVLHRDLKPPNIFISLTDATISADRTSEATIKLGDFGLAVLSSGSGGGGGSSTALNASSPGGTDTNTGAGGGELEHSGLSRQDSINECVGTHFYSAPEQRARGVAYDHRVDMYSCGIIFFEMMYPFSSGMERALQLEELRQTGKVPNEFLVGRPDRLNVIKVIESLLKHRPEERPTAAELLKSGLIPLKVEDEMMELALQSVAARDSVHHTRLLDMLFSMPPDKHIDFTFDYLSVSSRADTATLPPGGMGSVASLNAHDPPLHFHQLCQMRVFDVISQVFRNHGAVALSPPIITPKSAVGSTKTNAAQYLDPQGTIIKLPYTLTVPFARYIAQQSPWTMSASRGSEASLGGSGNEEADPDSLFDLRRYEISKVYRKNIIGGRPKEMHEADFDIVWSNPYAMASAGSSVAAASSSAATSASSSSSSTVRDARASAREKLCCLSAEVVKLCHDVLSEFVPAIGQHFLIKVNHSDLFDAVLDVVLASAPHQATSSSSAKGKNNAATTQSAAALQAQREDTALLRRQLCKLASSYSLFQGSWSKSPMRKQLIREKQLSAKQIDLLGSLFQLRSEPGHPESIFARVRDTLFSTAEARSVLVESRVIEHLDFIRGLFVYLRLFHHVDAHVVFDLSVVGKHDLYSGGLVFQALVPNTNPDVGSSGGAGANERAGGGGQGGDVSSTFPGAGRTDLSSTQNAYETIALGGQYDSLLASFMPPTASVPLSAVGVNFAIEKIVHAVTLAQLKGSSAKGASSANAMLTRRVKKSLYGGDMHASTILLYSPRSALLKERAALATDLWADNLPCLYVHPAHLTYATLKLSARSYMLRWLVIFRRQELKENGQVQVVDLQAGTGSRASESVRHAVREQDQAVWMSLAEVSSYIRGRMAGKREAELAALGGAAPGHASHAHAHAQPAHAPGYGGHVHSAAHRKPDWKVDILHDGSSMKASAKNQLLTQVKRSLAPVLSGANPAVTGVCAVDLPLSLIRALTSAAYVGPAAVQAVIEEGHAKQRGLCEQLHAYIVRKSGGTLHAHADTPSSGKAKDKAQAAVTMLDAKEKLEALYIFSSSDRKADLMLYV